MKRLSFVETIALFFAGIAGLASAVQAYISFETRGEVSRAIVFAERLDACSQVLAVIDPFIRKASTEARDTLVRGPKADRYSLPRYYYKLSSGNQAFEAKHGPSVEKWRVSSAAFLIVNPQNAHEVIKYFDKIITREIEEGKFMSQVELIKWLENLDNQSQKLFKVCRNLI